MPRYKATGNATLVGRFSSAVGTTRDDSKDRPPGACISYVVSVIGPASVCQRKAPLTSAIFLFVERCEAFAVILRAASPCHPPASRPAPCVHPPKSAGRGKNPFLFAMLFEKNIEIFSDPNPSVLCVFSICLPPFRGWTGGSRTAGSAQEDAIRNIAGKLGETIHTELFDGAFYIGSTTGTRSYPEGGYTAGFPFLDASRVVPTANENRPANVALPVALYIGLPA